MACEEYLKLIPTQHRQKPKFMATLAGLVEPLCGLAELLENMRLAFDLDKAVGRQLDAVGERVGMSRRLHLPLDNVYFALDTDGLGLDAGMWQGQGDPVEGLASLPDDFYLLLIRAKIAANMWDGTVENAYAVWHSVFEGTGITMVIEDGQNMSMTFGLAGVLPTPALRQVLQQGYIQIKPEGVGITYYFVSSDDAPLFALDADTPSMAGLDIGVWGINLKPVGAGYAA